MILQDSAVVQRYKQTMQEGMSLYYPNMPKSELDFILNQSIQKRYRSAPAYIDNSYKGTQHTGTLLQIADYIERRKPITTAFGTMFMHHETIPNPLADVADLFLQERGIYKTKMFKYPKGSEMFEHYNLMQQLSKIDVNGLYG